MLSERPRATTQLRTRLKNLASLSTVYQDDKPYKDKKFAMVVDESIAINGQKLLLTLVVPSEHQGRPLRHEDVTVLDMKRVKMYLALKPVDVSVILGNNPEMTRKFWYEDFMLFASSANVYVEMLREKIIPQGEIKESLEMFLKHEYKCSAFYLDNLEDFKVLKENGLYDIFIEEYLSKDFVCNNPGEKCHKTDFYISLIQRGVISDRLIKFYQSLSKEQSLIHWKTG